MRKTYGYIPNEVDIKAIGGFRDIVDRRAQTCPDVAVFSYCDASTCEKVAVGPEEFKRQRDALSVFLHEQGLRRSNIALLGPNSYQWILAQHAIVASDNVVAMLPASLEPASIIDLGVSSNVEAVFASKKLADVAAKIQEQVGAKVFCLEDIADYVDEGTALMARGMTEGATLELDVNEPAFISYTSGTTGRSKGVVLSQENLIANNVLAVQNGRFAGNGVCIVPLSHLLGVGGAQLVSLLSDGTFHINDNIRYMYRDFAMGNPALLFLVPMIAQSMIDVLWRSIRKSGREQEVRELIAQNEERGNVSFEERRAMFSQDLAIFGTSLDLLVCGGAPVPGELFDAWAQFGVTLLQGYGITECSPVLAVDTYSCVKPGSVGRLIPGEEVKIDRPDSEGIGEICVKGPHVMLEYYNMEQATAEAMEDGWFHTGDLGYLDEDLYLFITGRIKNLIILSNGENVSPEELEALMGKCPAVQEVVAYEKQDYIAVMVYPNEEIVQSEGVAEAQRMVRAFVSELNEGLAIFKRIRFVEFRNTPFARTPMKKIKRTDIA